MLIAFTLSDFYERNAKDTEDVEKYLLGTSYFVNIMQDGINLYVTHDRLNNASFRHKLHPISKIIF